MGAADAGQVGDDTCYLYMMLLHLPLKDLDDHSVSALFVLIIILYNKGRFELMCGYEFLFPCSVSIALDCVSAEDLEHFFSKSCRQANI